MRNAISGLTALFSICLCFGAATAATIALDNLTFVPPSTLENQIPLTLTLDGIGSDTEITNIGGTIRADLEFDFVDTNVIPTGLTFTGGQIELSDVSFSFLFGTVQASATGIAGTPSTPIAPGAVAASAFDAADHVITFDQGVIDAGGSVIDLTVMPLPAPGMGVGNIDVPQIGFSGDTYIYDAALRLPIEINQSFIIPDVPILGTVTGTLSGSGTAVSTQGFTLQLISGDFDLSQELDCGDLNLLQNEVAAGGTDPRFDVNEDGTVNNDDVSFWLNDLRGALDGDATLDGFVDAADFIRWNLSKFSASHLWCEGDFNMDGFVDASDFIIWNENRFSSSDSASVPEPASSLLAWMGLGILLRRAVR